MRFLLLIWMFPVISLDDFRFSLKDVGIILELAALSFLVPALWALVAFFFFKEGIEPVIVFMLTGLLCYLFGHLLKSSFAVEKNAELKHGLIVTALVWIIFPFFAALPFVFLLGVGFLHSYFESVSSLTTTGISILYPFIDSAPSSIILWRSFLGWIGGIGIIALAFIGILGVYSSYGKLAVAEGRTERISPGLDRSIQMIWKIYLGLTVLGAVVLWFSGLQPFDALNYSMTSISTNGMTPTATGLSGEHAGWLAAGERNYWIDIT